MFAIAPFPYFSPHPSSRADDRHYLWLNSQRGCSWYFIVSKVATVKYMNQYYAVVELRSEGNAAPLSIVENIT